MVISNLLKKISVRLVEDAPILSKEKLDCPEAVIRCIGDYIRDFDREVVCIGFLKADGTAIACSIVSMGSLVEATIHPREVFKAAFLANAHCMVMVHNHPSGNVHPSKTDTILTDRMIQACTLMGIPLVDHIIVGGDSYFSFKEKHLMDDPPGLTLESDYEKLTFPETKVSERKR